MTDTDQKTIGGLTVKIDRLLCVGFGDCIDLAPDVFDFDEEGVAVFLESADRADRERVLEACDACPVDALAVLSPDGTPLVP